MAPAPKVHRQTVIAGAGFAMLAVVIGAFGAHGLKQVLDAYSLGLVETAARYQMYHALALLLVGLFAMSPRFSRRWLRLAAFAFGLGIVLFSGSLYILALSGVRWWGAITPIGGLSFIVGWGALLVAAAAK